MIVYLLTKFKFFKNDHITFTCTTIRNTHQHLLLARAFFKNLSMGREQSTRRDNTIVRNSKGGGLGFCVFPPLGLHFIHFVNRFLDAQRYIIL